jgi:hypothetical protein
MKAGLLFLFLVLSVPAHADGDSIRVRSMDGMTLKGSYVEATIEPRGEDSIMKDVYDKLKQLDALGRSEYVFPDAATISLDVTYQGQTLHSAYSPAIGMPSEPQAYRQFGAKWKEVYALVQDRLEEKFQLKG